MSEGVLFDLKEFTVHDGPGIRATVFLKGCPLRCLWCHNPEGLDPAPQLLVTGSGCTDCGSCRLPCGHPECAPLGRCVKACPQGLLRVAGNRISAQALAERLHRLAPLLVDGGVTLSGGEPLAQPEFLLELLDLLRPLDTIVETSGYAPSPVFQAVAERCGTLYLDVKHADSARHRQLTGRGNESILANLRWLKGQPKPFLVRVPLIPGCNDDRENLDRTAALLEGAGSLLAVELLPYNPFAGAKYSLADMPFPLEQPRVWDPLPSAADPTEAFARRGIPCRVL